MKQIIHAVHIHAAPPVVYRALTTEAGLRGWWTTKVDARREELRGTVRASRGLDLVFVGRWTIQLGFQALTLARQHRRYRRAGC
jgi:uncharacterized protein YndB with AHSA1/START domain